MSDTPETYEELRPCPDCPDGSVWASQGPTSKICPTCKGYAVVKLNGGLCDEAKGASND